MAVDFFAIVRRDLYWVLFAPSDGGQDFLTNGSPRVAIVNTSGLRQIPQVGGFALRNSLEGQIREYLTRRNVTSHRAPFAPFGKGR